MMRRFELHRTKDVSGISGTGLVAQGVRFDDGVVALRWISEHATTAVHEQGMSSVVAIHGHGGNTAIVWVDEEPEPEPHRGFCTCFTPNQPARDCGIAEHRELARTIAAGRAALR